VENITWVAKEEQMVTHLDRLLATLWPDDKLAPPAPPRTLEQRETTKRQVRLRRSRPD
jgi:hypothetical protein